MPSWLRIVGGPNGLSLWTWLVSFTWTVAVTGMLVPIGENDFRLEWLLAVVASQIILGIGVFLAIRFALPRPSDKPRPTLVLVIFVALGITRAVTMHIGADITGYDDGFTLTDRLVFGVGYSLVFGILMALVVDGARQHSSVMANLRGAESALAEELRKEESELDHLAQDLVSDVQDRLLTALSDSHLTPAEIRSWASDVVRPLSHELIDAAQTPDTRESDQIPALKMPLRERVGQIALAMRLPSAAALIGIAESLAFLLVFQFESPAIAATHTLVGSAVIAASLWLMSLLYRPCANPSVNFLAVVAAVTFVGIVNVFGTQLVVVFIFPDANTYPLYVMSVIFIGLALSIYQAIRYQQIRAEDVLAETVQHLVARRQEIAKAIAQAHTQAARFLHDSIQGILYAAALRQSSPGEVHDEVRSAFVTFLQPLQQENPTATSDAFHQLVDMWRMALPVELSLNDRTANTVFSDAAASRAVVDVVSEGLTNAIKHGVGGPASVEIDADSVSINVTITSAGSLKHPVNLGLGSRTLDAATEAWSLSQDANTTVLHARLSPTRQE